jgi:hypothetical protein
MQFGIQEFYFVFGFYYKVCKISCCRLFETVLEAKFQEFRFFFCEFDICSILYSAVELQSLLDLVFLKSCSTLLSQIM